jgi:hypothetical protein
MNKISFISLAISFKRKINYLIGINIVEYVLGIEKSKKCIKNNQMAYNHTQNLDLLEKRLANGKSQLLDLLDQWHFKNTSDRSRLIFDYEKVFGEYEFKINSHYKEAKTIEEKLQNLKTKLDIDNTPKEIENIQNGNNIAQEKKNSSFDEIKFNSIYRNIVKKLHPDLNNDSADFEKYWDSIQFAYKSKDLSRLRKYKESLFDHLDSDITEFQEEYLTQKIEEIENYISEEKTNLIRLKYEEPFCFEDRLKDHRWVIRHRHLLRNRLKQAQSKVEFNKKLLANMSMRYKILLGDETFAESTQS